MHDQQRSGRGRTMDTKSEVIVVGLMLALVFAVLLPVLAQWVPSVYDDCLIETLPGLIQVARSLQQGGFPLWDFGTFCGAKPTYTHNMYLGFYPPMYPLFMLADTNDADHCFRWLMLVPYTVHLLWAALGAYAFARLALRLHPLAASLVGLLYGLSPEMAFQLVTAPVVITLSYIPWCALAVARFLETGKLWWWVSGTVLLALMGTSGNPNHLIRAYFLLSAMLALLWLLTAGGNALAGRRQWLLGRFLGGILMFAVSIGLAGFSWAGTLESIAWIKHAKPLTAEDAAKFPEGSMHPLSLVTLLIPGFFGNLDLGRSWGIGQLHNVTMTLPGGICFLLAACVAVASCFRPVGPQSDSAVARRWTIICAILFVAGLLTMMGRYTRVFGWFCAILPWFFEFPHPVYYRMAVCFSSAVLVGIGASKLLTARGSASEEYRLIERSVWALLFSVLGLLTLAIFLGPNGGFSINPFRSALASAGQMAWFLSRPVLYCGIALGFLICLVRATKHMPPVLVGRWLTVGIIAETMMIALAMFYWGLWGKDLADLAHPATNSSPSRSVQEDHLYQLAAQLHPLMQQRPGRCAAVSSVFDNVVWYFDGRALMGYSDKPLLPWYESMLNKFTLGDNERRLHDVPFALLSNMNVRYYISLTTPAFPVVQTIDAGHFAISELAEPLPYAYLQERVVALPFKQQLQRLWKTDLRQAVYIDPNDRHLLPTRARSEDPTSGVLSKDSLASVISSFDSLQQTNPIEVVQQRANTMQLHVQNQSAAMLVLSECFHPDWKVSVDGRQQPLLRVNYVQQGVWLEPGDHTIDLRFEPRSIKIGLIGSLSCLLVVIVAIALSALRAENLAPLFKIGSHESNSCP